MNNLITLIILIIIILVLFIITLISLSKNKIEDNLISLDIASDDLNTNLKQKYILYKEIIKFITNNISIREDAFQEFQSLKKNDDSLKDLITILDKTTFEINEYVDNYNDLLKNKDFIDLKRKLYKVQINIESCVDYYNNKLIIYNKLKNKGITSIASKLFDFSEFEVIKTDKKEISRLINLN